MKEFVDSNRRLWNEWTAIHERSEMYDLDGFLAGKRRLHPLEIEELGSVAGKTLLHLQCHFGLDTLSWADRGATVTGVDFSERAIGLARSVSERTGIPGEFVLSDLYAAPSVIDRQFDIVFTSYGAIYWLPDIREWARVAAGFVKPGGMFYIAEFHPFAYTFDDSKEATDLRIAYPYFSDGHPLEFPVEGSYADSSATTDIKVEYGWQHGLGEIVTALIDAGLVLEFVREHPFSVYKQLPFMVESADGYWRLPESVESLPLMFSLRARKR